VVFDRGIDFFERSGQSFDVSERVPNLQVPWNHWFHCIGHTYGTWLPGDPRGFRTREHRQHIDGDYKSPPPKGKYEGLHRYAKSVLRQTPVYLNVKQRYLCAQFLMESLQRRRIEVIVASMDSNHFHVLVRFIDSRADHWIGVAKRETSHFMKQAGACRAGGLWGKSGKSQPIADRGHQLSTARYILNHANSGAAVWFKGKMLPAPAPKSKRPPKKISPYL